MKKYLLLFIVLIFISSTYAYPCVRFKFKDTTTQQSVTNVKWEIWACNDNNCETVNANYWHDSGDSGTNPFADIKVKPNYPPNSNKYLFLFFHNNYIYKYVRWSIYDPSKTNPSTCDRYTSLDNDPLATQSFNQKSNGKAPSTLTVQNKIGEWLPLTIDTTSQLDADTASAISPQTTTYYPPGDAYKSYREIATTISLQIKDKKTNSVVFTDSEDLRIYSGTSLPTSFSWSPTDSSYVPGNYTVILTSHVTDTKCSSVIDDIKTQDIEVFPELPDDACIITAEPVSLQSPVSKGQAGNLNVTSYYYKLDKSYDAEYALHLTYTGITANYKLTFTNESEKIDKTLTGTFPASFSGIRTDTAPAKPMNTVAWTPLTYGEYDVKLELTSTDPLCLNKQNDFSRGTRIDTLTIVARDMDNDGATEETDCNDNNPHIKPGADDTTCDGIDQNCDGYDRTPTNQCACIENTKKLCSEFQRLGMCSLIEVTCTNGAYPACPTKISNEVCDDITSQDEDCDGCESACTPTVDPPEICDAKEREPRVG